jgi:phage-related protein
MLTSAPWRIQYFNHRVKDEIEAWPVGILADFLRLVQLMEDHGADLRLPHSRAMGQGLFELRCRGAEGIGRAFYCTMVGRQVVILHSFIKKTQETPERELSVARERLRKVRNA